MMLHDVICILVHHRRIQTIDIYFMMYLSVNSKYQISHRCRISKKIIIKTSQFFSSIARFTNRLYVISQIITCIEFRFVRFCSFRIDTWFSSRIYHIEKVCSKISNNASLKKSKFASLKKSHRWKNLHENFRLNSLEYRAENTNDCCEKMLKIQFSQMCCNQNSIDIIWRKQN